MLFAEKTPWLVVALLAGSIAYGVLNGVRWVEFQRATIQRAVDERVERYDGLKQQVTSIESGRGAAEVLDPRLPDLVGGRFGWTYAAMPPLSLSPLSIGQSDVLPYYFRVSTASKESVLTTAEIENPHRLLHGRFGLSFVVIYLFPLVIIALSYNVVSLEKEQGTLALLLSQPVSLKTVITGKIGLRAALLVLLVLLFSLIGMGIGGLDLSSDGAWLRLLFWSGTVAAYGAFWFGAVLFVTSFARSSATNALALAGIWLLLVVVLPSTLNMAVSVLYPMPSRLDMIAALRVASDEASSKGNQLLAKYYGDHPELVAEVGTDVQQAMNDVAVTRLAMDEEIEEKVRPVVDRYDVQLRRQQAFVDRFRVLSPAIVAQDALDDVAGTGIARYRHFVALVDEFHRQWRALFASMIVQKQRFTPRMFDELPQFVYREESTGTVLSRATPGLGILLGFGSLLGLVGAGRLRRYPIAG
jgi:ABC-2 type transport system permease protein